MTSSPKAGVRAVSYHLPATALTNEQLASDLRRLDTRDYDGQGWERAAAIDAEYSVTVPLEELNACKTVGELRQLIRAAAGAS